MIFRQLNPGACRTYLVASERTKEAVLIDPVLPKLDDYLALLKAEGLKLRAAIDTHTHADHISACAALQKTAGTDYWMHANSNVQCVSRKIQDGESAGFGDVTFTFMHA